MPRRKSIRDIMSQFSSIAHRSLVEDGNRVNRAQLAAFRYYDNIRARQGGVVNYDRKYSRSTYMGLNAG